MQVMHWSSRMPLPNITTAGQSDVRDEEKHTVKRRIRQRVRLNLGEFIQRESLYEYVVYVLFFNYRLFSPCC